MAARVLTDVTLLVGAYDLTGFSGTFDVTEETEMVAADNYAALGYKVKVPGLHTATGMIGGNADYATGAVNQSFRVAQVGTQQAFTVIPTGSAQTYGDEVNFMRGRLSRMMMQTGAVGEVAKFELALAGDNADVNGQLLAPLASRGALTGTQVSGVTAVSASQYVFGVLHVTGAVGTNLAVKIQSAATGDTGFASPTDRITFSTVSAVGFQFLSLTGPITDTRWRMISTVGSSTFTYACAFGVL